MVKTKWVFNAKKVEEFAVVGGISQCFKAKKKENKVGHPLKKSK